MSLLHDTADVVLAHRQWAGPAIGLLAFGESLVVVGTVIPATPALFLIGTLLGSGALDPLAVLPFAVAGAIAGYWLSWAIGRRIGHRAYALPVLAGHRRKLARVRLYFRRWGGPSLVFGRFLLGPLQSALPLIAGIAGMGPRRFHAWNVGSGVLWVAIVLTPGFLAARGIMVFGLGGQSQAWLIGIMALISVAAILVVAMQLLSQIWRRRLQQRRRPAQKRHRRHFRDC